MPVEQGYERQIAPGGSTPLPMVDAESQGAGLGRAIEGLGDTLHQVKLQAYRVDRKLAADNEAADLAAQQAAARLDDAKFIADGRAAWKPGHAEAVSARMAERRKALEAQPIREDANRRSQLEQFDSYATGVAAGEYEFETVKAGGLLVQNVQRAEETSLMTILSANSPEIFDREYKAHIASIYGSNLPADVKIRLADAYNYKAHGANLQNQINRGFAPLVIAQLDAGTLKGQITEDQANHYRNAAEVEIRRVKALEEAQLAADKVAARKSIDLLKSRLAAGEDVSDADIAAGSQLAASIGEPGTSYDLQAARVQKGVNRETRAWKPVDFEANINTLRAKGDKRSPTEDIRLKQLETIAPSRIAEFKNNPGGYMATIGHAAPPLSADPQSFNARLIWANQAAATTGQPVAPLLPEEAASLRDDAVGGLSKRAALADQLAMFGPDGARAAAIQIAPQDGVLQTIVALPSKALRTQALAGPDIRRASPALVPNAKTQATFDLEIAPALKGLPGAAAVGILETARNLSAARRQGQTEYDDNDFLTSAQIAAGGRVREINGGKVLLFGGVNKEEFQARIRKLGAGAGRYSNGTPIGASGAPVYNGDLLRMIPVAVGNGLYRFEDGRGGYIGRKGKPGPWVVDLGKVR